VRSGCNNTLRTPSMSDNAMLRQIYLLHRLSFWFWPVVLVLVRRTGNNCMFRHFSGAKVKDYAVDYGQLWGGTWLAEMGCGLNVSCPGCRKELNAILGPRWFCHCACGWTKGLAKLCPRNGFTRLTSVRSNHEYTLWPIKAYPLSALAIS
jgi:hypothetical protein